MLSLMSSFMSSPISSRKHFLFWQITYVNLINGNSGEKIIFHEGVRREGGWTVYRIFCQKNTFLLNPPHTSTGKCLSLSCWQSTYTFQWEQGRGIGETGCRCCFGAQLHCRQKLWLENFENIFISTFLITLLTHTADTIIRGTGSRADTSLSRTFRGSITHTHVAISTLTLFIFKNNVCEQC